jgi:MoxR-like ATPase
MELSMGDYLAYSGNGTGTDASKPLPPAPPWRRQRRQRARYQAEPADIDQVNAALYLRRPLLVTGGPGTGKSSLAYSVADELGLGEVLRWPISSKAALHDGLYNYDAIGRLQETNFREHEASAGRQPPEPLDIGAYIRLGPLGTALLPGKRPRVLLVDELDKSDIDLPNDLLDVFEEGEYVIPELARLPAAAGPVTVTTADDGTAPIERGRVRCDEFPLVIITSNGEREFPAPFMRRCLPLRLYPPDRDKLARIVEAHLGPELRDRSAAVIEVFLSHRDNGELATDQLLNAVFLTCSGLRPVGEDREQLAAALLPLLQHLDRPPE